MPAHLTLAIEMSNPSCACGVAIGSRAAGVLGTEAARTGDGRHDDLMPAIDRLTQRLAITPGDLAGVAVSIGPGGYTSLRIAIATAKMLCESLNAACYAVPSAHVVAHRARGPAAPFAVILASKDDTAHATVFASPGHEVAPGRLIGPADIGTLGVRSIIADRFLPSSIVAASAGIPIHAPEFDPAACLELAWSAPAIDPVALAPLYPREPEAVTKWRLRQGR